jgi:cell division protein FtsL
MNLFYKTSIFLAIAICIVSVFQSYQLRSHISSLRETIGELETKNNILGLEERERAREEGYKECIMDAKMGKSRYIITEEGDKLTLWKLEDIYQKKD